MSDYGFKVSKQGVNVLTALPKELVYSSQFDTLKIMVTGSITISLPSETFGAVADTVVHEESYVHGEGVLPFYLPRITGMVAYTDGDVATGASYVANDLEDIDIPILGYGVQVLEYANVVITDNELIFRVTRENFTFGDLTFGARDATLYYTIFFNRFDEEIDLL